MNTTSFSSFSFLLFFLRILREGALTFTDKTPKAARCVLPFLIVRMSFYFIVFYQCEAWKNTVYRIRLQCLRDYPLTSDSSDVILLLPPILPIPYSLATLSFFSPFLCRDLISLMLHPEAHKRGGYTDMKRVFNLPYFEVRT